MDVVEKRPPDLRFTYSDGRIGDRFLEMNPGKVHELLGRGFPVRIEDEPTYLEWCEAKGVESALPEPPTKTEASKAPKKFKASKG